MDAFSSDAVPAHLLTKEAFSGYASKLKAGGAIAVNVSNRYVGLAPVVAASAFANGMRSYDLLSRTSKGVSEWVVATADPALGDRLQRVTGSHAARLEIHDLTGCVRLMGKRRKSVQTLREEIVGFIRQYGAASGKSRQGEPLEIQLS